MTDKTDKKPEAAKVEPKAAPGKAPEKPPADPKADYLAAMAKHGARLCTKCLGLGLLRTTEGQPRTECPNCFGIGSVPCPAGEMEVFMASPAEIDPTARDKTKEVIKGGWQRFPAAKQVRPEQPLRCYHYRVVGNDLPVAVVTEDEIDLAVRDMENPAGALQVLVAKKLGA